MSNNDDDRTVMMTSMPWGEDDAKKQQQQQQPPAGEDEATVMMTEGMAAQIDAAQAAKTVQMDPGTAAAVAAELQNRQAQPPAAANPGLQRRQPVANRAPAQSGGGALVLGGIGSFLLIGMLVFLLLPQMQGMGREQWMIWGLIGCGLLGHLLLALQFFGGRMPGATAKLAGIFCLVSMTAAVVMLLGALEVMALDLGLVLILWMSLYAGSIFAGLWAFSNGSRLGGGMAVTLGILGFVGGIMALLGFLLPLMGVFRPDADTNIIFMLGGMGMVALFALLLGIMMFTKLKRA